MTSTSPTAPTSDTAARRRHLRQERRQREMILARLRSGGDAEPADWQEQHSPTDRSTIVRHDSATGRRIVEAVRRRRQDARLHDGMMPRHEAAAAAIDRAVRLISGDIRARSAAAELRSRGTGEDSADKQQRDARAIRQYRAWLSEAQQRGQGLGARLVRDVMIDGMSMRDAERAARMRNGTGKAAMIAALDLFADLHPRTTSRPT